LRLDTVISTIFNISRTRSKKLIESEQVKVNWTTESRNDFELKLLDIISIRGFGRARIDSLEGKTHKDRCRLILSLIRNKGHSKN
jgi:RNA-binding protein YlmH